MELERFKPDLHSPHITTLILSSKSQEWNRKDEHPTSEGGKATLLFKDNKLIRITVEELQ